uniref:TSA: Wollemia nobilis Ref_Wollemi_Transcript_2377_1507 transcribed RNA sequence n=1 Tax=Wollemia nobilis TaxID=56998 RepID=A0A0C9RQD6_9CONI
MEVTKRENQDSVVNSDKVDHCNGQLGNNGHLCSNNTAGKVITCRAAVAWGAKQQLVMEEVQVDPPQAMEVRIKITHTSLCHTDITFWALNEENGGVFPRIFGHEGAGIVESVGEGVTDLKEGDHVIPLFTGECGTCVCCRSSKTNQCQNFKIDLTRSVMRYDDKTRFSIGGKPVYHFMATSTFSEYTVVDYACVAKIDEEAPLERACLLGCGIATGIGAVWNAAKIEPGSTVAIFGLGTVGLAVAEGARAKGASKIIGLDTNPSKFPKAKLLGVTDCVNPKDHEKPIHEVIHDMTDQGVDYSFECIGNTDVLYQAFLATNKAWGLTVLLGLDAGPRKISLHPLELFDGRKLVASIFGGLKGRTDLPPLVKKYMNKEIQVDEFVTQDLPFSDINKAFDLLLDGNCLRTVIHL